MRAFLIPLVFLAASSCFVPVVASPATDIQRTLALQGYNVGAIDGIIGKNTISKLKMFCSSNDLDCQTFIVDKNYAGILELIASVEGAIVASLPTAAPLNLDMCPGIYHDAFFDFLQNKKGSSYFFFMVGDPDGRCELGFGPTKNEGFLGCESRRKEQNIKNECALFAEVDEIGSYEISPQYKTWVTAREAVNDAELNDN